MEKIQKTKAKENVELKTPPAASIFNMKRGGY